MIFFNFKKLLAATVALLILAGMVTVMQFARAQEDEKPFVAGDVNGNGEVDIGDARLVLQHLVDKITLTGRDLIAANVDGKGVSISSARLILQYLVDKIDGFPGAEKPPEPPDPPEPVTAVNPVIEAADYDAAKLTGGAAPNDLAADFTSIGGHFMAGDYLVYQDIDFGEGECTALMMLISSKMNQSGGIIDVFVDEAVPTKFIAIIHPPGKFGDERAFYECYAPLEQAVSGVHDVILSFNDDMEIHIDWFKFSAYDGTETKAEKDARMAWWRDCHFGQFIHLGAYSHLGGIYNGSFNSGNAEWIMCDKGISKTAYAAAAAKPFNPSEFNAAEIVGMAKATGQKYIAFTSRHHEGFSMYDTKIREFKDYCLMTYGDYKGPDPLMELSKECRKQDIKFGVYFSFADWHDVSQNGWFGDSMPDLSVKDEYKTRMKGQLREIIEYYDPDLFWFDGEFPNWWTRADGNEFYRFCRTMKPSLIINDRIGKNYQGDGDYHIIEVEVPELPPAYDWEICTSPNDSWGHVSFKTYWKNAKTLVEGLVDITSKNGVMLFNIGPDGKGRIPDKPRAIFGEIGSWMDKHSEAIHGARGTYYSYLPNYIKTTTKDGRLYLHLFQFPENNTVSIPALKNEILGMKQMDGGAAISYTRRGDMLDISLDGITPDPYVTVIEIAVDGMPAVVDSAPKSAPRSADLARGAVSVTASSGSSGAANVINGINSTNSRWTAGNGTTGWVELQFAAPITANSADLRQYENHNAGSYNNYTNTFVIEYWDGSQWAAAYTGYDIEIAKRFDFTAAVTSDRFRFRVTEGLNPVLIGFGLFNVTWPE